MSMDILLAALEAMATKSDSNPEPIIKSYAYQLVKDAFQKGELNIFPKIHAYGVKMILDRMGVPYTETNDHPLKYPSKTVITIDFTIKSNI